MPETPTHIQHLVNLADGRLYELIGLMKPVMASDRLTIDQRQIISWLSAHASAQVAAHYCWPVSSVYGTARSSPGPSLRAPLSSATYWAIRRTP